MGVCGVVSRTAVCLSCLVLCGLERYRGCSKMCYVMFILEWCSYGSWACAVVYRHSVEVIGFWCSFLLQV